MQSMNNRARATLRHVQIIVCFFPLLTILSCNAVSIKWPFREKSNETNKNCILFVFFCSNDESNKKESDIVLRQHTNPVVSSVIGNKATMQPSGWNNEYHYDEKFHLVVTNDPLDNQRCLEAEEETVRRVKLTLCNDTIATQVWVPSLIPETYDSSTKEAYFQLYNPARDKYLDINKNNRMITNDEYEDCDCQMFGPLPIDFFNSFFDSHVLEDEDEDEDYNTPELVDVSLPVSSNDKICQKNPASLPHMAGRWLEGFPTTVKPLALCNGKIFVQENGDICVEGRVTFEQLLDAVGGEPMFVASSSTVSVNGLIITSQGNVGLAGKWTYIYDYITSYTINGTYFPGDAYMIDNTFVASRGTIDGFCLDKSIRGDTVPEYYRVSVKRYPALKRFTATNVNDISNAAAVYISYYALTAEFHENIEEGESFDENELFGTQEEFYNPQKRGPVGTIAEAISGLVSSVIGKSRGPNDGDFHHSLPFSISALGIIRSVAAKGVYRTADWPNALYDGDEEWLSLEQIQMDTEWTTFLALVEDGFFTKNRPPVSILTGAKHIHSTELSVGCWREDTAGIVVGGPTRAVNAIERYASKLYEAIEQRGGTITLHFGKRIPRDKKIVQAALQKLEQECGVEINVSPSRCLHPSCQRTDQVSDFEWPAEYYAF